MIRVSALLVLTGSVSFAAMTSQDQIDSAWPWVPRGVVQPVTVSPNWSAMVDASAVISEPATDLTMVQFQWYGGDVMSRSEWLWLMHGFDPPEKMQLRPRLRIPLQSAAAMVDPNATEVEVALLPYAPGTPKDKIQTARSYDKLPRLPRIAIPKVGQQPEKGIFQHAPVSEALDGGFETDSDLRTYSLWVILILILSGVPLERLIRRLRKH